MDGGKPAAKKPRQKVAAQSRIAQTRQSPVNKTTTASKSAKTRKSTTSKPSTATRKAVATHKEPASQKVNAPRKRRHYLPAEERRQLILEAAKKVFAHSGLQGSRTRDLAQAAGINQATLFEHFSSKDELFAAAILQPLTQLLDGVRERYAAYEAADSPENLLSLLQTGMQKHLENIIEIYPLLVQALFSDQAAGKQLYHEQVQPLITARTELMRNVIKPTMDPELVELASFGMFFAIAMDRIMTGKTHDLGNVSRQLGDLILFGCSRHQWDERNTSTKRASKNGRASNNGEK